MKSNYYDLRLANASVSIQTVLEKHGTEKYFVFATSIGGDFYAWERKHMNQVYYFPYSLDEEPPTRLASSFAEFIQQGCVSGFADPDWEENWRFSAFPDR